MSLKNKIENNIILTIIGFSITAFIAGITAHDYLMNYSNRYISEEVVDKKFVRKEKFVELEDKFKTLQSKCERLDTLQFVNKKEYLALHIELMNLKNKTSDRPQNIQNKELVKANLIRWTESLNSKNYSELLNLYATEVDYYQTLITRNQCVENKMRRLDNTNYRQKIMKDIIIKENDNGTHTVDFTKEVKVNGKTNSYKAQLHWKNGMITKEM